MNKLLLILVMAIYLGGCSVATPIQKADESKSAFEGALYKGTSEIVTEGVPESESYRLFHQGATGFVPPSRLLFSAERRAKTFCLDRNKVMQVVKVHRGGSILLPGDFPKVELTFTCIEKPETDSSSHSADDKYTQLRKLKLLLDDGIITQKEFETEKSKILSE